MLYCMSKAFTHTNSAARRAEKNKQMDMLHGPMLKNILVFALPLALGGILQQLFTSADMAVVFWFDGNVAQSAVNSNGALVNLLINLFSGMSVGVTVAIAERVGKGDTDDLHSVVFTSLCIAVASGIILLCIGVSVSRPLLAAMQTPSDTLPLATEYLTIYFLGMPFLMVYNFGAAILRGVGDTKKSVYILLATGILNIALNLLFVAALKMSVAGVAIATVISNVTSAVPIVIIIMKDDVFRIKRKTSRVRAAYIGEIIAIGMPAGLQGVMFSIANVIIQSAINTFGVSAVAGNGDAATFEMFVYFFVSAFSQAAVAFFGQNHAAGAIEKQTEHLREKPEQSVDDAATFQAPESIEISAAEIERTAVTADPPSARCRRVFNITMSASAIVSVVLPAIFMLASAPLIRIYTTDPIAIEYATIRMKCALAFAVLSCLYEIPSGALRGMGHSLLPTIFTVVGSCVFRIVWIYTVYAAYREFWLLIIVYPISWTLIGAAVLTSYYIIARKSGIYGKRRKQNLLDKPTEL